MDYLKFKELRYSGELKHHGIPGMKWGVRRFQNEDGSRTPAGLKKDAKDVKKTEFKKIKSDLHKQNKSLRKSLLGLDFAGTSALGRNRRLVGRAAKYVQNQNMSYSDAMDKSKKVRNARGAAYVGVMATMLVATLAIPVIKGT